MADFTDQLKVFTEYSMTDKPIGVHFT